MKIILYSLMLIVILNFCGCRNTDNIENKDNNNIAYENTDDIQNMENCNIISEIQNMEDNNIISENNVYALPLGVYTFGEKNSTFYAYYEFTESGNAEHTCYWYAETSLQHTKNSIYKYEVEEINEYSYIMHLTNKEDESEYDIIFDSTENTIVDTDYKLTYTKQIKDKKILKLTYDMITEIKEEISTSTFPLMIRAYFSLLYPSDDFSYIDFEVTNSRKIDDYSYHAYGKLWIEGNYGDKTYAKIYVAFSAEINDENSKGYDLRWNVIIDEDF